MEKGHKKENFSNIKKLKNFRNSFSKRNTNHFYTNSNSPEETKVQQIQDNFVGPLVSEDEVPQMPNLNRTCNSLFKSIKKKFIKNKVIKSKPKLINLDCKTSNGLTAAEQSESILPPPVPPRRITQYLSVFDDDLHCSEYFFHRDVNIENMDGLETKSDKGLSDELFCLSRYGWYWGPIKRSEAEEKLQDQPDGAFLVRDSCADNYVISLSFRSSGRTLHTRIEHTRGSYGFYTHFRFASVVELIETSMKLSKSAVLCYSKPRTDLQPGYPVRLMKPVSRFTQVRSLQYLCRFVIRQYTNVDNIQRLPLPAPLQDYIEEGHY